MYLLDFISSASRIKHKRQHECSLRRFSSVLKNDFNEFLQWDVDGQLQTPGCRKTPSPIGTEGMLRVIIQDWGVQVMAALFA